jgi:NADH dehydrogenase
MMEGLMAVGGRKRILVLGGGFAGMFAAKELRRRVGRVAGIELINEVNYFTFQPLLPEMAAGGISVRDAVAPLRRLLPGVRVRQAQIYAIDLERKIVTIFQGLQRRYTEVGYDHLVLALGQTVDLSRIPSLAAHALTMKTLSDALTLRNAVIDKLEHADITALPEVKKELLTFKVIGGGFSGVETAGEMMELIERSLAFYPNINRSEVRVLVVEFADRLLGELPPSLGEYARTLFERRGIEVLLKTGIREATGTAIVTTTGEVIGTRTLVATIGNAPSPLVARLALPNERGRLRTDRTLRVEGRDDVWSLGDAALIPLVDAPSERGHYAPPTAQFAVREARVLARNVAAALEGRAGAPFVYKSARSLRSARIAAWPRSTASGSPACRHGCSGAATTCRSSRVSRPRCGSRPSGCSIRWWGEARCRPGSARAPAPGTSATAPATGFFEEGNRADGFYAVVEGAFELRVRDGERGETLRRIGRAAISASASCSAKACAPARCARSRIRWC